MRDTDDSPALLAGDSLKDPDHSRTILAIQIPRRFVPKDEDGIIRQGTRDCDALALPSGHAIRRLLSLIHKVEIFQERERPRPHVAFIQSPETAHRKQDVLERREFRQQEMKLKHEPKSFEAKLRPLVAVERCRITTI
jgi:hypothetical protein